MAFEVACCISSHDSLTFHYLTPLARHPLVSKLWIVRPRESAYGAIPKAEYVLTPARAKPVRFLQMYRACRQLARRTEVRAFVSFNPVPYGLIALFASRGSGTPIHLGFIGSDWYTHSVGPLGRWFMPRYRKASFITATGVGMRRAMMDRGLDGDRIAVLPHCVDPDEYPVSDPANAKHTFVFVGELNRRKRVDLILHAFADVAKRHPAARLCIVGDGAEGGKLRALAQDLGIAESVTFTGFVRNVYSHLADARVVVVASEQEGFPFALVEGMCAGLVPVSTPVGTIPDLIEDGRNGLLCPRGDATALAACMMRLLEEDGLYDRIRPNVLAMREQFSFDAATAVWDRWLRELSESGG